MLSDDERCPDEEPYVDALIGIVTVQASLAFTKSSLAPSSAYISVYTSEPSPSVVLFVSVIF